jgi:hypothetical protein
MKYLLIALLFVGCDPYSLTRPTIKRKKIMKKAVIVWNIIGVIVLAFILLNKVAFSAYHAIKYGDASGGFYLLLPIIWLLGFWIPIGLGINDAENANPHTDH